MLWDLLKTCLLRVRHLYWSIIPQLQTIMSTSDHDLLHNHSHRSIHQINCWLTMKCISSSTSSTSSPTLFLYTRSIWTSLSRRNDVQEIHWWIKNDLSFRFGEKLETVSVLTRCNVSGQYNDQDVNIRIMSTNNMFNQKDWLGNSSS